MDGVDIILNNFGTKLVTDLRQSLVAKGVTFGGGGQSKLSGKIRFEIKRTFKGIVFNLVMPDYSYYVDKGRKPGKVSKEAQKNISEWAKRKGIVGKFQSENLITRQKAQESSKRKLKTLKKLPFDVALKSLTFLISRKIDVKGYKGNSFLTDVINDGRIVRLQKDISEALKKQIIIDLKTQ